MQENAGDSDDLPVRQMTAFGELKVVPRPCPLCGDTNDSTPAGRYSLGQWKVKACRICGFTYITSAPDYDALFEQMSWEKTYVLESERRNSTRKLQQAFSKKTRWRLHLLPRKNISALLAQYAEPGNVVDLGCGSGGQLSEIADTFIPHGIEVSRAAATAANALFKARGGYALNAPCLHGLREFPAAFFTGATLRSYLEHELHPADVLRELHRVMKPGGVAIVKVPNFACLNRRVMRNRWCGFRYPDHLNYFTPATLTEMARKCGFRTWFGVTWRLPTSDNMWAILRKDSAAA